MKNDDRIVKLLAEMLKKQDQYSELIDSGFNNQSEGFKKILLVLDKHKRLFERIF